MNPDKIKQSFYLYIRPSANNGEIVLKQVITEALVLACILSMYYNDYL